MTATKNNYKISFILDLRNREEGVGELIEGLKNEIEASGGDVSKLEDLGKQDFARAADQRYTAGHYVQFDAAGPSELPDALWEKLRLNSLVSHKMIQKV